MPGSFKLATWNVNSLNVRLAQVLDWLAEHEPDVLALQETKVPDDRFPLAELQAAGYHVAYSGQRAYNGVAILTREVTSDVSVGIPGFEDEQRRVIGATVRGVRIACLYVPNGQVVGSDKFEYKLGWLHAAREFLRAELAVHERLAVVGDFNIAPAERDVHDPRRWEGKVLFSDVERAAFAGLLDLGLSDAFRLFEQPAKVFSWWPYGKVGFPRNLGLRIDHVLVSSTLAGECRECRVDTRPRAHERPSDHAPVIAQFELQG
ncbi:exodeoxyribonuclease III [Deinococcus yavapaiensis]|uniref:Exodeoxyribonuclease III n=1 Tax=Deinococcus yavapaiensis KR-236 TaxID=694435 RepID=A0A318S509_9DEIO|nr:exodeoxyribonuclease III [Deinococcus yavapaiensis]PYE53167.1 exodeoxyribonuclease III [Deinococcus yavapaiensis KR-236]